MADRQRRDGHDGRRAEEPARRFLIWMLIGLALLVILGNGESVVACGIDGIPSMSLDGRLVTINHDPATKQNLPYWAPFVLASTKQAGTLRFAEDASELHKSLTAQAFATPFQWNFGDGSKAAGIAAAHHYSRPGWYKVDVSYYYTPQKRWVVFDSAQLHIPGESTGGSVLLSLPLILLAVCTALGLGALGFVGWRVRGAGARATDRRPIPRSRQAGRSRGR
ncbi:MAG: PKD domain-containing protein [Chloroflexota bacterium]